MSEKTCSACGSKGPFQVVADGERCGACGDVSPVAAPARYEQPDVPPKPLAGKMSAKNPLGA